jgi:hypothetical protein
MARAIIHERARARAQTYGAKMRNDEVGDDGVDHYNDGDHGDEDDHHDDDHDDRWRLLAASGDGDGVRALRGRRRHRRRNGTAMRVPRGLVAVLELCWPSAAEIIALVREETNPASIETPTSLERRREVGRRVCQK